MGQSFAVSVPESWHEEMRGRAYAFLIAVDDRLPTDTAELVHELIDSNEYGVAVEMMHDSLIEQRASLTAEEERELSGMLSAMGLDSDDP